MSENSFISPINNFIFIFHMVKMLGILLARSLQSVKCKSRQDKTVGANQANQQAYNLRLRSNRDDESKEYVSTDDVATTVDCSNISLGYGVP